MWFCFQWRVMQEKIWTDDSYKLKPCYFREVFCINSLEEGDWTALEQGIESQTNQVREKKTKSSKKDFPKACIAKFAATSGSPGLLWKLPDTAHSISNNTWTLQLFGKTVCGLHITWVPLKYERQKNKDREENQKAGRVCHCVPSSGTNWGKVTAIFN